MSLVCSLESYMADTVLMTSSDGLVCRIVTVGSLSVIPSIMYSESKSGSESPSEIS